MRAFTITMFLMSFYLALSILTTTNTFSTTTLTPNVASTINQTYHLTNTTITTTSGGLDTYGFFTTWKYLSFAWQTLTNFFTYIIFFYNFMTTELLIPPFIALPIQMLIYIIYILTFFELVTGRVIE